MVNIVKVLITLWNPTNKTHELKHTLVWVFVDCALAACCNTNAVSSCLVSGSSCSPGMLTRGPPLV